MSVKMMQLGAWKYEVKKAAGRVNTNIIHRFAEGHSSMLYLPVEKELSAHQVEFVLVGVS